MPLIAVGFTEQFWVLAMRTFTGRKCVIHVLQHSGRPQIPRPPMIPASSRTPICLSSTRQPNVPASSPAMERKSIRSRDANTTISTLWSKLYRTLTRRIRRAIFSATAWHWPTASRPCSAMSLASA